MPDWILLLIGLVLAGIVFLVVLCLAWLSRLNRRLGDLEGAHERFVRQTHNELAGMQAGFRLFRREVGK